MMESVDWTHAATRLLVNLIFIGLMIGWTSKHLRLRRFSFTFMMISLVVYFLCYTLKNFDLNLGMALGLFAIFGIIRYRTEPLATEEMTYLFITIGMAVINALSSEFLSLTELAGINGFVLISIFIGERFLLRSAIKKGVRPTPASEQQYIVLQLPYDENKLFADLENQIDQEKNKLALEQAEYSIVKVDRINQKITVHLYA